MQIMPETEWLKLGLPPNWEWIVEWLEAATSWFIYINVLKCSECLEKQTKKTKKYKIVQNWAAFSVQMQS